MRLHPLTPRQLQVLGHIAYGLSDAEISTALGISENRVTNIVRTAMHHLHARSRSHAVAIWLVGLGVAKTDWPRTR